MRGRSGGPDLATSYTFLVKEGDCGWKKSPLKWECLGEREGCVCVCYHIGGNYLNLSILNFELDIKELDIKDH